MYEAVAYCAMPQFLTLGANVKTLKFSFFCRRVYYEKLGHILKPLVPTFCPDLFARLRDIAEKQVPANLKPIGAGFKETFQVHLHHLKYIPTTSRLNSLPRV